MVRILPYSGPLTSLMLNEGHITGQKTVVERERERMSVLQCIALVIYNTDIEVEANSLHAARIAVFPVLIGCQQKAPASIPATS